MSGYGFVLSFQNSREYGYLSQKLSSLIVWDSVYYIRIAKCGYEFEQMFAFFPVLPVLIRLLSSSSELQQPLRTYVNCEILL